MQIEFIKRCLTGNGIMDYFKISFDDLKKYNLEQSIAKEAPNSKEFDYPKNPDFDHVNDVIHTDYNLKDIKNNNEHSGEHLVVLPIIHGDKAVDDDETFNTYTHMTLKELKKPKYPYGLIKDDFFDELA